MIRVGIIGLGQIGMAHIANLRSLRGCRVAGGFDLTEPACRRAADTFGLKVYPSEHALLADPAIDAVVLATPSDAHCDGLLAATAAGKHVFVEKPLCDDVASARDLLRATRAFAGVVQVGFCERFNVGYLEAKRQVATIGPLRLIRTQRHSPFSLCNTEWPLGAFDTAVHNFDLVLWLTGLRPRTVRAYATRLYSDVQIPTAVTTVIQFDQGVTAVDETMWLKDQGHPLEQCSRSRMTVVGENGFVEVDLSTRPVATTSVGEHRSADTIILGGSDYFAGLKLQLEAFLRAIEEGSPAVVTVLDGYRAQVLAELASESSRNQREVSLENVSWD